MIFRAAAGVVLAAFLAGPGARAHCFLSCAAADRPASQATCHDEPAPGTSLGEQHSCGGVTPALVTALKRAAADATTVVAADATTAAGLVQTRTPHRTTHGPPGSSSLRSLLIPLRI